MRFSDAMAFQARMMNDLQKSVMKIRMVPGGASFPPLSPRCPRRCQVLRQRGQPARNRGHDTDLDKSILDMLAEPLAHLVRNAVTMALNLRQNE